VSRALGGLLVPVTTPFGAHGEIDAGALRDNVEAHLASGIDGIVVAGTTGEAPLLEAEERGALVGVARSLVPSDRWLIAGVGAESTRETLHRARVAAERGADALLVVAPHYFAAAAEPAERNAQLRAHYLRVADESPLPVVLYTIPKYTHFPLDAALVGELARHEKVIGIKDSSGDASLLAGYLASRGDRFAVLTGSGGAFDAALGAGAAGGILAVALFAPALAIAVRDARRRGDASAAGAAQSRLAPLAREIVGRMGVAGVKAALDLVGLAGGDPRLPLRPATAAERAEVAELLDVAGVPVASQRR
jgi:4-hydroxy-2-oxoglutarate aldolase